MTATSVTTKVDEPKATVLEGPPVQKGYKLFIGNLSFKTTKESLISFASTATAGKVLDANIITKHKRSLGYGFITFETEKEAEQAAKDLDSKSLNGREINVEVARPRVETTTDEPKKTSKSKRNARRRSKTSAALSTKEESSTKKEDKQVPLATKKKSTKKEGNVKKEELIKKEAAATSTSTDSSTAITNTAAVSSSEQEREQEHEKTPEQIAKEGAARRRRNQINKKRLNKKKSAEKAMRATEPSKTSLFVANLPYVTTDDDLNEVFKDYKLISAHVSRMNNGCSKGYGFVEFENEEERSKALESVKDIVLEGRSIYLKIALSQQKVPAVENDDKIKMEESAVNLKKEEMLSDDTIVDALKVEDTK
ncbi:hypothetical protein [Parasitella parasitica]|uniref:RRM domain-containing protein n=1 Tax=Parasitella parasitica TaxID=35722 RepID=A0A0B7MZ67_9FUNG|nr:hypothetical protein [Parasitella parasitica]